MRPPFALLVAVGSAAWSYCKGICEPVLGFAGLERYVPLAAFR